MDWPTVTLIISVSLGIIGGVTSIWVSHKGLHRKPSEDADGDTGDKKTQARIDRCEKQIDFLLKELMEVLKE